MTEKQVVPKYMADWLKFCKDNGFKLLEGMSPYASAMEEYLDDFEACHTKEELQKAGFDWVFSCDGVEVKEL